jgi:hypothetical protein
MFILRADSTRNIPVEDLRNRPAKIKTLSSLTAVSSEKTDLKES